MHIWKEWFYEIEISRKMVEKFEVFIMYGVLTKQETNGPIIGRGINSIELFLTVHDFDNYMVI